MKDMRFTFNLHVMQKSRWQYFTDEGHLFYINSLQKKQVGKFREKGLLFSYNLHGMLRNRWQSFTDKGYLFDINGMGSNT